MTNEVIAQLKHYCKGKQNTDKVEISVSQLRRFIKDLTEIPELKICHFVDKEEMYEECAKCSITSCIGHKKINDDGKDAVCHTEQ